MITGLNHTTLAVRDLDRSFRFYTDVLGLRPVARWYKGAYLLAGTAWICLTLDDATRSGPLPEYTHVAFSVTRAEFVAMQTQLERAAVIAWQQNHSHGSSFYFLDPDGHKLEIHDSDLASRIESLKQKPPRDLILF
ncbi:fosfomycin resistance glutathione transferase [Acidipila sp. EB88]|uniref:fosfomycin resistance glutathione transferase n=1 Tax=Acidipila sp. EB88 TaxID=2305226 RepID=UPI000F5EFADB|nr:fosfomycin resistance glutathione transferase [Acidipila sp. EB88]RRA49019.1 glutathione transferase [Acidipila sp. EB88]